MLQRLLIPKTTGPHKTTVIADFLLLSGMTLAGSWSVVGGAHIQALIFSWCWNSQDHGRLSVGHVSKHSHQNLHTCWTPWSALQQKKGCGRVHPC